MFNCVTFKMFNPNTISTLYNTRQKLVNISYLFFVSKHTLYTCLLIKRDNDKFNESEPEKNQ